MGDFNNDIYDDMRVVISKMSQALTFSEVDKLEKEFHKIIKEYRQLQYTRIAREKYKFDYDPKNGHCRYIKGSKRK